MRLKWVGVVLFFAVAMIAVGVILGRSPPMNDELLNQLEARVQQTVEAEPNGHYPVVPVTDIVRLHVSVGISLAEATARLERSGFRLQKANPGAVQPGFEARYVGRRVSDVEWQIFGHYEYEVIIEVSADSVGDIWGRAVHRSM